MIKNSVGFISDLMKESSFVLRDPHTYLKALTEPCCYTVIFYIENSVRMWVDEI